MIAFAIGALFKKSLPWTEYRLSMAGISFIYFLGKIDFDETLLTLSTAKARGSTAPLTIVNYMLFIAECVSKKSYYRLYRRRF